MILKSCILVPAFALFLVLSSFSLWAVDPPPPVIDQLVSTGSQKGLRFAPYPAAQTYTILNATNGSVAFSPNTNFFIAPYPASYTTNATNSALISTNYGYEWRTTNATAASALYRLQVMPLSSNALLTATVLNRLAYGPTPDELERVTTMGPQAYIDEQLNMQGITETMDNYVVDTTNSVPGDAATNWTLISVTGTQTGTNLIFYLTQAGSVYVDDISLKQIYTSNYVTTNIVGSVTNYVTNTVTSFGSNLLGNGDFESALTPPWTVSGILSGSSITNGLAHSGSQCLRVVSSGVGSNQTTAIWQSLASPLTNNAPVLFSYWYLPSPTSSLLTFKFSTGSGLQSSAANLPTPSQWIFAKATGVATNTQRLYLYLSSAGDCYVDGIKLVAGSVAEAGANLLANGDFESPLGSPWVLAARYTNSVISLSVAHSGSGSLHLIGTSGGSASTGSSLYQNFSGLTNDQVCTVSYWYLPATPNCVLTARLDGNTGITPGLLNSMPDADVPGVYRRLNSRWAAIDDYRSWFCQHAVSSHQQLLEILSQFLENHFVTQYSKSRDYLDSYYDESAVLNRLATDWEYREMSKWRNALLNPQCTFYDLLRISAESPAMIVYLDTAGSKGNNNNIANENYARELLELFTFGVDNGYDQNDIVLMSRAWTGWSVELVDAANADNPFAPASITYNPGYNSGSKSNIAGVWAFKFKAENHGTNRGDLFAGKTYPARFGSPWTGSYQLHIPARAAGATNGILDGYEVIAHLANQPFTEEYISIKLCRLFVHDDFPNPVNDPAQTNEYNFYNYAAGNLSPEAGLVHQCMLAWENGSPKGNLRAVLNTIFSSELFRSHGGSMQKVKTPLEFVASSVRALQSVNSDGTATARTDGYSFTNGLSRMGGMALFDRAAPDGYPESGPNWISAGTLTERIRYLQAFCMAPSDTNRADAVLNICDPVALLKKKLPSGNWSNAGAVADYFLGILYPGEGAGNLQLYRNAAVTFLNTQDNGVTADSFSGLNTSSAAYDTRVRGMVAMLMTLQRFQEQ